MYYWLFILLLIRKVSTNYKLTLLIYFFLDLLFWVLLEDLISWHFVPKLPFFWQMTNFQPGSKKKKYRGKLRIRNSFFHKAKAEKVTKKTQVAVGMAAHSSLSAFSPLSFLTKLKLSSSPSFLGSHLSLPNCSRCRSLESLTCFPS